MLRSAVVTASFIALSAVSLPNLALADGYDPPVITTTGRGSPLLHADGIQAGANVNQNSPTAFGGRGGQGGQGGVGGTGGVGNGGAGGSATGGAGGSVTISNSNGNGGYGYNNRLPANSAYAPPILSNNACSGRGLSVGGMGFPGGGAIGYQGMDDACRLGRAGMLDAEVEYLCSDPEMHKAMIHTGHGCFDDRPAEEQKKILQRARYGYADGDMVLPNTAIVEPQQPPLGTFCASLKGYVRTIRRQHPECAPYLAANR